MAEQPCSTWYIVLLLSHPALQRWRWGGVGLNGSGVQITCAQLDSVDVITLGPSMGAAITIYCRLAVELRFALIPF